MKTPARGRRASPVLHGLVATLLLFSASMAVQRMLFSQAPGGDEDLQRPASGPVARSAASSSGEIEDDGSIDLAVTDSDRPAAKRAPATKRDAGTAPDQTAASSLGTSARDQDASHPPILVTWNLAGGPNTQRVELFSPDGALYQRFSQELTSPTTATTTQTWVPVSGSWITQHSLFGSWRVAVYLDGGATPVATSGFALAE